MRVNSKGIALILSMLMSPVVQAMQVEILATHPQDSQLKVNESYYVHIAYQSDVPLNIWVRPYYQNQPAAGFGSNPAPMLPAGSGETYGWFFAQAAGQIDEIQIKAGFKRDDRYQEAVLLNYPVSIEWTMTASASSQSPPDWIARLRAEHQQLNEQARQRYAEEQGPGDFLLGLVISLGLPAYLVLQVIAWTRFRESHGLLVTWPIYVFALLVIVSLFALMAGSNLWPIWLILICPLLALYLLVLLVILKLRA